jgi:signal transduction histidine kinase
MRQDDGKMRVWGSVESRTSDSFDVQAEQVSLVIRQLPLVLLANIINPLLTASVLAAVVPVAEIALWSAMLVGLTGIRFFHFMRRETDQPFSDDPARWAFRLAVASGISGCLWGIGLVLLFPEPLLYRLFVAFVLGGMAAGSVATLSPLLPVVTAFLLPCMLPLTIRLALEGSPVWLGMSALTLLFTCGLWIAAWKLNGWISTMILLKLEKSRLADELSAVLADLERKVEQRTSDLRLARDEANRANQMKTRFLAAASHDLGQPFQAMRLFIDLLDGRLKGSRHYEYLQGLQKAHMSGELMLTSLLDLSRLESGTVQIRVENFPIADLLERLETEFRPLPQSRSLTLRIRSCGSNAVSDPVLLHQIVANLLGNALRYTTSGGILLACRRRGTTIRLEVWDTGVGIPADRLDEIFEEFRRIESVDDSSFRGVGLGLSIVRRTADLLNHEVAVCSRVGRGSMFSIAIPSCHLDAEVLHEPLPAASAHPATGDGPS